MWCRPSPTEGPKLKDFNEYLANTELPQVTALREEVETFASEFHMPGGMF